MVFNTISTRNFHHQIDNIIMPDITIIIIVIFIINYYELLMTLSPIEHRRA